MKAPGFLIGMVLIHALCGCASSPPDKPSSTLPPPPALESSQYTIRPGDLLNIAFAGESDLAQEARVDWNGMIHVPIVAPEGNASVKAAGLSPSALAARLSDLAKQNKMLVDARAAVQVTEYAGQAYTVLGQVPQPGRYTFPRGVPPRLPIEEAIALAGGCTRLAKPAGILVKRGAEVFQVDLERLSSLPGQPPAIIIPGDVITVPERRF